MFNLISSLVFTLLFLESPQQIIILHLTLSSASSSVTPTICIGSLTTSMNILFVPLPPACYEWLSFFLPPVPCCHDRSQCHLQNIIVQRDSCLTSSVSLSSTIANKKGLQANSWCFPSSNPSHHTALKHILHRFNILLCHSRLPHQKNTSSLPRRFLETQRYNANLFTMSILHHWHFKMQTGVCSALSLAWNYTTAFKSKPLLWACFHFFLLQCVAHQLYPSVVSTTLHITFVLKDQHQPSSIPEVFHSSGLFSLSKIILNSS